MRNVCQELEQGIKDHINGQLRDTAKRINNITIINLCGFIKESALIKEGKEYIKGKCDIIITLINEEKIEYIVDYEAKFECVSNKFEDINIKVGDILNLDYLLNT